MLQYLHNLNRKFLLSPKVLYFFINLQFYTLHQFRGNFATDHFQISKQLYGRLLGIILFVTFFTNIFIATMNDKFNKQRFMLILLLSISCVFFQLFFVPSYITLYAHMFWVNLLFYLMFNTSIPPLLDKITLEYLSRMPNIGSKTYGKQRMWGTVGYLVANWVIEKSIAKQGNQKTKKEYNFFMLKYYQAFTTALAVFFSFMLISPGNTTHRRNDIMHSWKELIKNKAYMFFILIILLNGVTRAAMTMYLTIYLTDIVKLEGYELPSSWPGFVKSTVNIFNNKPLATSSFFGVILEIVILYNSEFITTKFGLYYPLLFAQVFQLLRFLAYFLLNQDSTHAFAYICIFELMKGINFGLTHTSAVQIATKLCPSHLKTTSQMIYSGTFTGLASVIAGFLFGAVFSKDKMENKEMGARIGAFQMFFLINVLVNLFCIALFVWKYGFVDGVLRLGGDRSEEVAGVKKKENKEPEEDSGGGIVDDDSNGNDVNDGELKDERKNERKNGDVKTE